MTSSMPATKRTGLLTLALAVAVANVSILQTLVVPVLSMIAQQLDTSLSAVGWALTANLLAAAVLTPLLGRLGDVYGKRPVMIAILVTVLIGTVIALTTTSLPLLIVARVLQGSSYGLFPLAMSVLREQLPPARLTMSMAVVSATLGGGGVVGLLGTGLLTRGGGDYHRPFWLGLVITVLALILCWFALPHHVRDKQASTSVDWLGAGILGVGLVLLLLPISQGADWGWGSPQTIGCFIASAVVLVGWILAERRIKQPLAKPSLLARRAVMLPNLGGLFVGFGMFCAFLTITNFAETPDKLAGYGFGASVLSASAIYMLPGGVLGVVLAPLIGRFVQRAGGNQALLVGAGLGLVGFLGMVGWHDEPWEFIVFGTFAQLAVSFGFATLPALLVAAVDPADTGVANSVNSIARSVGSAISSALIVALLESNINPLTGFPKEATYRIIMILGAAAFAAIAVIGTIGIITGNRDRRPDPKAAEEQAQAYAGEFAEVSGVR
ncbi:MFS transporter [Winogradskya consettensis]|uniref:MFS transporter n=1 Tax=Winogradskya consettensis TaxID=113560 RepID=A0A919VU17_9ACTN|nr:MFS transporter [Actinoplanes consettensis]GIM69523.1 MFS transporter [Actinoplanes consettensis]